MSRLPDESTNSVKSPKVTRIELMLKINTGDIIYGEFETAEEAMAFARHYANNPEAIRDKITPKKRKQ